MNAMVVKRYCEHCERWIVCEARGDDGTHGDCPPFAPDAPETEAYDEDGEE